MSWNHLKIFECSGAEQNITKNMYNEICDENCDNICYEIIWKRHGCSSVEKMLWKNVNNEICYTTCHVIIFKHLGVQVQKKSHGKMYVMKYVTKTLDENVWDEVAH